MQCQGKTRIGKRCRNRSIDGELFCDVHMRVNHTHNLALAIPLLLSVLAGYFFFFGLFFETALLSVFDVNYLQYAGLEDLFLNMIRFGGIVTLLLLLLWTAYAVILAGIFSCILIYQMIRSTQGEGLGFLTRLKIISLSLYVLFINILLRALYIVPTWRGHSGGRIQVKRENFTRTIFELRNEKGELRKGRPFLKARQAFQNFLSFKAVGNHRLVTFSVLLLMLSLGMTNFAVNKAEYAKGCALLSAPPSPEQTLSSMPSTAYVLGQPCHLTSNTQKTEILSLGSRLSHLASAAFDFTPVTLSTQNGGLQLLHLATTSRFDIFYNGKSASPMVIPKGILISNTDEDKTASIAPALTKLETRFSFLEDQMKETNARLSLLKFDIDDKMVFTPAPLSPADGKTPAIQIPITCWKKIPDYIVSYDTGDDVIRDAEILDLIVRLSIEYRSSLASSLVITGYADTQGSSDSNLRISNNRARKVGALFERLGLERHRIFAIGMGENDSLRFPHRRVEIRSCQL